MKKNRPFILVFVLCFILINVTHYSIVQAAPNITIYVDNEKLAASSPPFAEKGVTLVPMRLIFEALGAEVAWSDETQTIIAKKGTTSITLTINKKTAFVNTDMKTLVLPPKLKSGTTYVPLRFISESLGAKVEWNENLQRVSIYRPSELGSTAPILNPSKKVLSVQEIGKFENTIAFIYNNQIDGGESFGSGFVISADGKLVTNYHVIANAKKLTISFDNNKEYTDISILGYNAAKDIAVLKINTADKFSFCKLGDSNQVVLGDDIVVIGNPMGLRNTLSTGIISSLKQQGYIQITAPISPGSSGGALFNRYGEVIGMATAAILEGQNLGFCIPINELKNISLDKPVTLAELNKIESRVSAPQNVKAFPLSSNEIALQWDYDASVDYYYVYFSDSANGKFIPFLDDNDKKKKFSWYDTYSMTNYDLAPGETVYYRVTAVKNGVESTFSKTISATTSMEASDQFIKVVKDGRFEKYPKQKVGTTFDAFFGNPEWYYFRSDRNEDIVEFTGTCMYGDEEVTILLQFAVSLSSNTFKTVYMERDGMPISRKEFEGLLLVIFE